MEEEDEEEESMEEVGRNFASILDAQDTKYPAEHTFKLHTLLFTSSGTDFIEAEHLLSKRGKLSELHRSHP